MRAVDRCPDVPWNWDHQLVMTVMEMKRASEPPAEAASDPWPKVWDRDPSSDESVEGESRPMEPVRPAPMPLPPAERTAPCELMKPVPRRSPQAESGVGEVRRCLQQALAAAPSAREADVVAACLHV